MIVVCIMFVTSWNGFSYLQCSKLSKNMQLKNVAGQTQKTQVQQFATVGKFTFLTNNFTGQFDNNWRYVSPSDWFTVT